MNIALFTDTYAPDINGVATSSAILRDEFIKHGHQVLVVTTELPTDSDYQDHDELILRLPGIDLKKLYGYRASRIFSFKGMKEIKEFDPQVIHIQTEFGVGIFGKIAGEILNVPVCYTYHTMWADYAHYLTHGTNTAATHVARKIIEKISKIYGDTCTELIVPSYKTADALKEYGISKDIHVVPTGLQLERFDRVHCQPDVVQKIKEEYHLQDCFVVTFLGRIAPEKSIDVLINAMNRIQKSHPHIRLMLVGGGPQIEELQQQVQDMHLEDVISFTGVKDGSLVPSYYHASNLFVSASLTETQGLTFIEAMASGIPVLARYDENLKDVIEEGRNGYFFHSEDELVEKLVMMSQMDLTAMSQHAYEDAKQFSSERFYEKIMTVYEKALSNHHYCYEVKSMIKKDPLHYRVSFACTHHQFILELSQKVIDRYGLSVGQVVDKEELDALRDQQQVAKAYNQALKYLSYHDYTYAKMRQRLAEKDYDDIQLDMTMDLLVQKRLIDDEEFTKNYFAKAKNMGIGVHKIVSHLKNEGVSPFLIDEYLSDYSSDFEYDKAIELIRKLYEQNTTKPKHALIAYIKNKLFYKGFSQDVVEKALQEFDFVMPEEHTQMLLRKEYERVYKRYKNRYDSRILKSKIITFLVQKGYEYNDVIEMMNEMWEEPNDQN